MTEKKIEIHWFRNDLRLSDNPALANVANAANLALIYILDDENAGKDKMGAASRWWLHHSLTKLNESLNGKMNFFKGDAIEVIKKIIAENDVKKIVWNRAYEPWQKDRDAKIKEFLKKNDIEVESFNGSLLWEPWEVTKDDGTQYRVFTPFYRNGCLKNGSTPRDSIKAPKSLNCEQISSAIKLDELGLLPKIAWDEQMAKYWKIGEKNAQDKLYEFLENGINGYKELRNFPNKKNVSELSPHLHFGEVSPNQVWHAAKFTGENRDIDHFLSELGWREFSFNLLHFFPDLKHKNWQEKFDKYPWKEPGSQLKAWQKGQTGIPIVDAGMRQLWQIGYVHNRLRMVVGSFLVKNLRIHWTHGEEWFWDCLVDADHANNAAGWQWIAGCGADAAPYFRIFNPVTQGEKFDPDGEFTKKYVPELAKLPAKYLFAPWEAPKDVLEDAGIELGKTYPKPIVDLKESRQKALDGYNKVKGE